MAIAQREWLARFQFRLITFLVSLLIGFLAYLTHRYSFEWDITASGRNTLSQTSREVLKKLKGPLKIKVFIGEAEELRTPIRRLIDRYRRQKGDIELLFINPDLHPEELRRLGIQRPGEVIVEYGERHERIAKLSEKELTSALLRLLKRGELHILFIEGHGERSPFGQANFDLGHFGKALEAEGYQIHRWSLVQGEIPKNTALLVLASPQADLLPVEVEQLKQYLDRGGNFLWLHDPGELHGLEPLLQKMERKALPGNLVDPQSQSLLGLADPTLIVISYYPDHPILKDFEQITLFPGAAAFESGGKGWSPLLVTSPEAWNETDLSSKLLTLDPEKGERIGPLGLGWAFEKEKQRIVLIGDGDFLANQFIGNGGNLDLGLRLIRWLTHQDTLIEVERPKPPDAQLQLSSLEVTFIAIGIMLLTVIYLGIGAVVWWRRR